MARFGFRRIGQVIVVRRDFNLASHIMRKVPVQVVNADHEGNEDDAKDNQELHHIL
jgi:hypothetical protein